MVCAMMPWLLRLRFEQRTPVLVPHWVAAMPAMGMTPASTCANNQNQVRFPSVEDPH